MRHPTTKIRDLTTGKLVEIAGVIRADGAAPLVATSGVACVARAIVTEELDKKGTAVREIESAREVVAARIKDESGSCEVDLETVELLGEAWERRTGTVLYTEVVIPEGAVVVASGFAREGADPESTGYRSAGRPWRIGGGEGRPLVLSVGGHARSLWRYDLRAVIGLAAGVILLVMACVALYFNAQLG